MNSPAAWIYLRSTSALRSPFQESHQTLHRILHPAPVGDVTCFVLMLFDKLEVLHSGRLDRAQIKAEVIDKPLFVEFFGVA